MEEYPFEKALRDSRINMIFEGTNEILRVLVSLSGMKEVGEDLKEVGRALKAPLSSLGILSDYAARKVRGVRRPPLDADRAGARREGEIVVAKYARSAAAAVETLLRKYGKNVIGKEYHQERLANVAIDLYASLAVLSRATAALAARGRRRAAEEVRVAQAFVRAPSTEWSGTSRRWTRTATSP